MKGRLIGVKLNDSWIPCEQDCTLNYSQEQLPTSSKVKGGWKDSIGGYKEWSIDVSGRLDVGSSNAFFNKVLERFIKEDDAVYEIYFGSRIGAEQTFYLKGKARLQNGTLNANVDNNATRSESYVGCGALECWAEEYRRIINAMPANADKPNIVDTSKW